MRTLLLIKMDFLKTGRAEKDGGEAPNLVLLLIE
jgi:hypothetical protein